MSLAGITPTGGSGVRIVERDVKAYLQALPPITPVARRMAALRDVDVSMVVGTGQGGRITKADVVRALERTPCTSMEVADTVPLQGIRKTIADRMAISAQTTAPVTLMMDVDATQWVEGMAKLKAQVEPEWGFAPGINDLLVAIVAQALKAFPYMNARFGQDAVEVLAQINVGVAVDTDRGLIVPVVHNADQKNLRQVGFELRELVAQVRDGSVSRQALTGGTFTLTNLGMFDVDAFTPVINPPEAAILGLGRIAPRLALIDGQVQERWNCTLCLTFDHRIVDGAPAARFLQAIRDRLEEFQCWMPQALMDAGFQL